MIHNASENDESLWSVASKEKLNPFAKQALKLGDSVPQLGNKRSSLRSYLIKETTMQDLLPSMKEDEFSPRKIAMIRNLPASGLVKTSSPRRTRQSSSSQRKKIYMQLVPKPSALLSNIMYDIHHKKKLLKN